MTIVERNDVDIKPLFSWTKKLEFELIRDDGESTPVFMRVLGDADIGKARVSALRRSAELRRKLKDQNSDERLAYVKDIDDLEKESIVSVIVVFSVRELSDKATKKLKIRIPKAPKSDAKTSVQEKYQEEVDSYPERRQKELRELLDKEIEVLKASLDNESKEILYKKYVSTLIDELCEQELLKAFKEWCCYLGSYRDAELTEKLFSSFNEFANLESSLKDQFIREYSTIELYGDDLKKLRRVMP